MVPHSPRKAGPPHPGCQRPSKAKLGFSPIAWSVEELPFFAPGRRATQILLPRGQCAARCRPSWPPAKEGADRGGPGSSPALRSPRSAPSGPAQAARDLPSTALLSRRGLWPPELPGSGGPGATSDPLPPSGRGDLTHRAPKARASTHLACAVWSGTAWRRAARRPGRKCGLPRRRPRHFREALGHWRTGPSVIRS